MSQRTYSVVLPGSLRMERPTTATEGEEQNVLDSSRARIAYVYERMKLQKAQKLGGLRATEYASETIRASVEQEIFARIAEGMGRVSLLTDRAAQALKEDDAHEVGPEGCIEFAFVFSQINHACERFARLVNPISDALRKRASSTSPGAACPRKILDRPGYAGARRGTPLKQAYDLLVATGKLLERIDTLSRVFRDDPEVSRLVKLVAPERTEISEGFAQLSRLIRFHSGKWRGRVEDTRKLLTWSR